MIKIVKTNIEDVLLIQPQIHHDNRGYFFDNDRYIIDIWWDHNKDLYETKTPYKEIKNVK